MAGQDQVVNPVGHPRDALVWGQSLVVNPVVHTTFAPDWGQTWYEPRVSRPGSSPKLRPQTLNPMAAAAGRRTRFGAQTEITVKIL